MRKLTSWFLIFAILFANLPISASFADLEVTTFKIRNVDSGSYTFNPGDTFSVDLYSANGLSEDIVSVFAKITFGNNAGFSYQGNDERTRISGAIVVNPIPSSAYDSGNGFSYEITDASHTSIGPGMYFDFSRASNAQAGFLVSPNITTYENNLTAWYEAQKSSDASPIVGSTVSRVIYANVKPHVIDYYFEKADASTTTNQIQGVQAEMINLVVKVKDYNGCGNIDGGIVKADMSPLGLDTAEPLTYVSCDTDGKTALFKKTEITTLAPLGDKVFTSRSFTAIDEDGNSADVNDTHFSVDDKKNDLVLTVVPPAAPTVTLGSISEEFIGGPSKPASTLTFSGSQNGELKVVLNGDGECSTGTVLLDWTGSGSYAAYSSTGVTIPSSSLQEGANQVTICEKNTFDKIGSYATNITKDTLTPALSNLAIAPASVITNDSKISYQCDEDGTYQVELGGAALGAGTFVGSGSAVAHTTISQPVINSLLVNGTNPIAAYCIDKASNIASSTGSIKKTPPTPSMAGLIGSFADADIDYDGLDGRDVSLTFGSGALTGFDYFESYRIYLLPAAATFGSGARYVGLLSDSTVTSWTGDARLTKDSLGNALVSGASYKVCIAMMATSGMLGTEDCSAPATLTADVVAHPVLLSARFTSDTNLELTTNATLDSTLSSHSGSLIAYQIGSNTFTGVAVSSVNSTKLNITIPALGDSSASGTNLIVQTGAIHANGGGFNNYFSSGSLLILDGQVPVISAFSKSTAAIFGNFYKGNITLNYTFSEAMSGGGNTNITFTRISGNPDGITHFMNLTTPADLSAGTHTKTVNLDSLGLVSGATYRIQVVGKDTAGNSANSGVIPNIGYDNHGPTAPILSNVLLFSTLTPTLAWAASTDDFGNGSGIQKYVLQVYGSNTCSAGNIQTYSISPGNVSQVLNTLPTDQSNYGWNLFALDNLDNTGSVASCGAFRVDTTVPVISNQKIYNQTLGNSTYTRDSDVLQVRATIPNSDTDHIWIDASSLAGSATYNHVSCGNPTGGIVCTYSADIVTYTFITGFATTTGNGVRQVVFSAQNTSGGNDQSAIASITADNTAPHITTNTLFSPNGGETWSGSTGTITWNTSGITDLIGIKNILLEYSVGGGSWNPIATVQNNGSYSWNLGSLTDRNDYRVRLTAEDFVGHTTTLLGNADFLIDRVAPVIASGSLIIPNTRGIYAGGQTLTITWNSAGITDNVSLLANPIILEYSTDTGATWNQIATNLPNTGSYDWTVPSLDTESVLVRLTARDIPGNTTSIISGAPSIIDSTVPSLDISYAGSGGNTVPTGRKINSTGVDLSLASLDAHLSQVSYQFANTSDSNYWDVTSTGWTSSNTWNTLCTDGASLGTDGACSNISTVLTPTVLDGKNYTLIIRSVDEAGNITFSPVLHYTGDTTGPVLDATPQVATYLSGSITYTGTATDTGSSMSSVKVQIQKGSEYWDGSNWVATPQSLLTSTTDFYANWNYTFTPPLADIDGQSYTLTFTAYDSAFKINNSSSITRTATKDVTGPIIDPSVFTFSTGGIYKGNTTFTVTWNPGMITTTGAALASNPINLAYNFTGSVVTLATNLPNTGSYSFSLPTVDTTTARIIMTASDTLGNTSPAVSSSAFTIDSVPPSILSVQTIDQTASGKIDGLLVHFSEHIQNINTSAFSITDGTPITGWSWGGIIGNQDTIVLDFTATGTTASTPTLAYAASGASDIAGNALVAGSLLSIDGAAPRLLTSDMYDQDANGKLDTIRLGFSENLAPTTTLTGWTLSTALPSLSIQSLAISGTYINLSLTESSTYSTDVVNSTLSLNNTLYTDLSGNQAGGFSNQALADKAAPVLLSAITQDTNGNHKIDKILATFSESLTGSTSGWNIASLATGSTFTGGEILSGATISFPLGETSLSSDADQIPTISYAPGEMTDSSGNALTSLSKNVSDGVAPQILSRLTRDADGNGKIDSIKITFAENINDNTTGLNLSASGYVVTGFDTSCDGSSSDDTILCANLQEGVVINTDATPVVQILSNTSLADLAGNLLPIESSGIVSTDAVGPVITTARYESGSPDKIILTFSEVLSGATLAIDPAFDFLVGSGGSLGTDSTRAITTPDTITISLGSTATALTPGVSTLSIASGAFADLLGNVSPGPNTANTITLSPTILINEVMWSNTGTNSYQYIELYNPGSAPADITGWKIKNAGGNGITKILPSASIPANGYYLIANADAASGPLDIVPDYITTLAMSENGQNNLILMNGAQTIDSVLANPWPKGDKNLPGSMERNTTPGNGLNTIDWHTSSATIGFDAGLTARGTPGSTNTLDGTAPTIDSVNIADNVLLPTGSGIVFDYTYSDNVAVNLTLNTFTLEKWMGSSYLDVTTGNIATSGSTLTGATYALATISSGKYRATLQVTDTSGNTMNRVTIFYVDQLEFSVNVNSTDIGTINSSTITYAPDVTVTVKTLGAGFSLTLGGSGVMNAGINTLSSWSGAVGSGFGFDYSESGSGGSSPFVGTLQPIGPTTLATYATGSIDADGLQKTYVYTVRYGAKIAASQAAGNYAANTLFGVIADY